MTAAGRSQLYRALRLLVPALGTVAILFLGWKYLTQIALVQSLQNMRVVPLLAALLLYSAITAIRCLRFILIGAKMGLADAFCIASIHSALLRVMPLRTGELSYGFLLKRMGKGGHAEGLVTLLVLRVLDFSVIMCVGMVAIGAYIGQAGSGWLIVLFAICVASLALFFSAPKPIKRAIARLTTRPNGCSDNILLGAVKQIAAVLELQALQRVLLVGLTVVQWLLILAWLYAIMIGIGVHLAYDDALTVSVLGVFGSIIPLSLVGSFGPLEGGFALGFYSVGFNQASAAAQALVISAISLACAWLLAIPCIYRVVSRGDCGRASNHD